MPKSRRKHGGVAIGAGSDGCVFDGTFSADGNFTESEDIVTKIYIGPEGKKTADKESDMMAKVAAAVGAGGASQGVVVGTDAILKIDAIPETAWSGSQTDVVNRGACKILKAAPAGTEFYGVKTPRIDGTLIGIQLSSLDFTKLDAALATISAAKLAHMDMASRNIFYKADGATAVLKLGDFGSSISLADDAFDEGVQEYADRYSILTKPAAMASVDGLYPGAMVMLMGYVALLKGEAAYNELIKAWRDKHYLDAGDILAGRTWTIERLQVANLTTPDAVTALIQFEHKLGEQFGKLLNLFAGPGKTYEEALKVKGGLKKRLQDWLSRSDTCVLGVIKLLKSASVSKQDIENLYSLWFPGQPPAPANPSGGGGNSTSSPLPDYSDLYTALSREISLTGDSRHTRKTYTSDSLEDIPGPPQVSGGRRKRKTRRARRKRVKMSRRR